MKNLTSLILKIILILSSCIAIAGALYVYYIFGILKPYEEFRAKEIDTIPLFDALNEGIERSLPDLPPNSVLEKKSSVGIQPTAYMGHGRWMRMAVASEMPAEYISEYYRSYLLEDGWLINPFRQVSGHDYYYRGTSCIQILLPSEYVRTFYLIIWHDFKSQSFSPSLPNALSIRFFELDWGDISTCP